MKGANARHKQLLTKVEELAVSAAAIEQTEPAAGHSIHSMPLPGLTLAGPQNASSLVAG